jgi:hypothetical protein
MRIEDETPRSAGDRLARGEALRVVGHDEDH